MDNNKYFIVSRDKEFYDTEKLIEKVKSDKWIDSDTIIVNCMPEYSSSLSMILNHKLSHLNENELFANVKMEIPNFDMSQVWNDRMEYQHFDIYLKEWYNKYIQNGYKYLFVTSGIADSRSLNKIRLTIRTILEPDNYRFASLYNVKGSSFVPDYQVEDFDGKLIFWWQNGNMEKDTNFQ